MYGSLEVAAGGMYSGKSTYLVRKILQIKNQGHLRLLVLSPKFDDRYGEGKVSTHSQLKVDSQAVDSWELEKEKQFDIAILDEMQFFTEPYFHGDITEIVKNWLMLGTNVVTAGLDMNYEGAPWEISAKLLAMADKVTKLTAICSVCGDDASKTLKTKNNGSLVELGSAGLYEARCNVHWFP